MKWPPKLHYSTARIVLVRILCVAILALAIALPPTLSPPKNDCCCSTRTAFCTMKRNLATSCACSISREKNFGFVPFVPDGIFLTSQQFAIPQLVDFAVHSLRARHTFSDIEPETPPPR